jgi:hypothetical protein
MRPSFLAFEPSLTYTLIRPWCKLMLKTLSIVFSELLILESCVMSGGLWQALSPLPSCFITFIFSLLPTWVACGRGHHYWIIFRHKTRWPIRRSFICFGPLSNSLRSHHTSPQLHISIPSGWYPHRGAFEWDNLRFLPSFNPISPSWV